MTARRAGFTFVELLVSVTIVGLLSSIVVPKYHTIKRRALATRVLGDFQVVRVAALSFFADSGRFPAEAAAGELPPTLRQYLPQGFEFRRDEWSLDYDFYAPSGDASELVGVSAATLDPQLDATVIAMLGNNATISINGRVTLFIYGTEGAGAAAPAGGSAPAPEPAAPSNPGRGGGTGGGRGSGGGQGPPR